MNRFTKQTASYWKQLGSVVRNEFRTIFKDGGVMLILIFALIIYATAYSLAYGSQVLRNVPIGVVDECRTPTSRSLIDTFNAGPNTYVAYNPTSMEEAKELFYGRKIYGVVYIPSDYEEKLYGGEQANVAIYADASYFLMYRQVFQEVVTSIGKTGAMVEFQRLIAKGANIPQAQATTQPVIYQSHNLFNPYLGYGTFVMPAIIMVIIQQTMLIGIGMIGGTWREFGLYRKLCPAGRRRMSTLPIVLGRGLVYALIYAVTCTYILGLHYRLFLFPMNGATGAVMLFMAAYLAACIAMGIAVSTLFRYRENSLLLLLWTSIPVLMLSGVSYPRQGIPDWLFNLGQLFPSSHGVNGFIRIQTMGASIPEVFAEIKWLIILTVVYGGLACIGIHQVIGREQREHPVRKENGDEGSKRLRTHAKRDAGFWSGVSFVSKRQSKIYRDFPPYTARRRYTTGIYPPSPCRWRYARQPGSNPRKRPSKSVHPCMQRVAGLSSRIHRPCNRAVRASSGQHTDHSWRSSHSLRSRDYKGPMYSSFHR